MQTNQQFDLAFNLLQNTGTNLFLTGKAGTGKTTFLKRLKEVSPKRMIVVSMQEASLSTPFSKCRSGLTFRLHRNTGEAKQISRTNSARTKSILSAVWTCW